MDYEEMLDRFELHYEKLISEFTKKIGSLNYKGMPEPHIPIIGSNYSKCKYKIAFYGIDTKYWHNMEEFMDVAKENPKKASVLHLEDLENMEFLDWTNNFHTSFWDFILEFISAFYHADIHKIRNAEYPELLRSFIWGNTNSIERYDNQASDNEVPQNIYEKIKKASQIFDDSEHLIQIAKPNVMIVLNWHEDENWFINKKSDYHYYKINDHLFYYYKRSTQTHISQTHHPRSLVKRFGFSEIINELMEQFVHCNVWDKLPDGVDDIFESNIEKSNSILRNELIANIAEGLIKTHSVMCGQQLVEIFNGNGITKDNGDYYSPGRGIYKTISSAWNYYHDTLGDVQTAYNIAMSFVNSDGDYAYE